MMSGTVITHVPFAQQYRTWMARMTAGEINTIRNELNAMINGTQIQTAGWMPGSDWTGTPFQPIYDKAAMYNQDIAARCFGLIVWEVFMARPEKWTSGRFENNGEPIGSRTYFRVL